MAPGAIGDRQRKALRDAFEEIERLACQIETVMTVHHEALPLHRADLSFRQVQVLHSGLQALREKMDRAMTELGIQASRRPPSAARLVRSALLFAELTLREVDADRIQGYGKLAPDAAQIITRVEQELVETLHRIRDDFDQQ